VRALAVTATGFAIHRAARGVLIVRARVISTDRRAVVGAGRCVFIM